MISKFLTAVRVGLVAALLIASPDVARAQISADVLYAYNNWVSRAIPPFYYKDDPADRAKLAEANRVGDVQRVQALYAEASQAAWLAQLPQEKAAILQSLQQANQLMQVTAPTPYPAQLQQVLQQLANQLNTVHTRLVQMNGGQEVLNAQNLAAVTPTATTTTTGPAPGTGTGTGTGTTPGTVTPGAGPGSLLGVGSETGPAGTGTGTGTTANPTTTAAPTTNTTASAPTGNGTTASTGGAVNRGAAKQGLTTAEQMIRTQLSDQNLAAGAILAIDASGNVSTLQAAKDSLGDIASYINRPPLSTNFASDVQAIVGPLQGIATANFGGAGNPQGAFQMGNQQIAQARERILAAIAALSAKVDSSQ